MTPVERLAREMALIYAAAKGFGDPLVARRGWDEFADDATVLYEELQAPIRSTLERWRHEAQSLDERAERDFQDCYDGHGIELQQKAQDLRRRIAEVERAMGEDSKGKP